MRLLIFLIFLGVGLPAWAGGVDTFSLDPANPSPGSNIYLRVDNSEGCYPADGVVVTHNMPQINVRLTLADFGPCQPEWNTPRFFSLGAFGEGIYQVLVSECVNAPENPCTVRAELSLGVFGDARSRVVPTVSLAGLSILLTAVAALAAGRLATMRE